MAIISRRGVLRTVVLSVLGAMLATTGPAPVAHAGRRTRVDWVKVELPKDKRAKARRAILQRVLRREARREKWGSARRVRATVKVTRFTVEKKKHVVRVTCTATGRLVGGPAVRTKFSFGDHPEKQLALEKTVLTLVARGLVTRLASVSRRMHPAKGHGKGHRKHGKKK